MLGKHFLITATYMAFVGSVNAATVTHYDIDFNAPTHTVGSTPTTGTSPDTISQIKFGQPTVESAFGSLTDTPLVFNPNISTYEQIQLDLGRGYDNYSLSFDMETANLTNSLYSFDVTFDTPNVQTLDFHGGNGMRTYNSSSTQPSIFGNIGNFSDNSLMHVDISADLVNHTWSIDTGIYPTYTGTFYADNNDVRSIRFNLSPWYSGTPIDPNISVGIDNIKVTSTVVPVPAAFWLFGSGLLGLLGVTRFQRRKTG